MAPERGGDPGRGAAARAAAPAVPARWAGRVALGAAAIVALAWLLAPLARSALASAPVGAADRALAAWLQAGATPAWVATMVGVGVWHSTAGILALAGVAAAALWLRGERRAPALLIAAVPGGMLLNVAVKHAVQRARPDAAHAYQALSSYSFPSGHVAGATLLYGAGVVWLWPRLPAGAARAALVAAAAALVLLVAASRVLLGLHFASDCVGAVGEALLWLAVCLAGTGTARAPAAPARGRR